MAGGGGGCGGGGGGVLLDTSAVAGLYSSWLGLVLTVYRDESL